MPYEHATSTIALLRGERVELRRVAPSDAAALLALRDSDDAVQERWPHWWGEDLRAVTAGEDGMAGWWIHDVAAGPDAAPLGFIQHYQEADPDYRHAGIDIFLVAAGRGRGLGTDAVRTLARHLVHDLGHHRLIIDPAADNEAAIHCYRKVGFRPVGVLREYERGADGSFHDGLLMDLVARELT